MTKHSLVFLLFLGLTGCATGPSNTSSVVSSGEGAESNRFDYPSVAAALAALRSRPDLVIHQEKGWTGFEDRATLTIWTFTPPGHRAHPAVVKRTVVQDGMTVYLKVTGRCEATKAACDKLMAELAKAVRQRMLSSVQTMWAPTNPASADIAGGGRLQPTLATSAVSTGSGARHVRPPSGDTLASNNALLSFRTDHQTAVNDPSS